MHGKRLTKHPGFWEEEERRNGESRRASAEFRHSLDPVSSFYLSLLICGTMWHRSPIEHSDRENVALC